MLRLQGPACSESDDEGGAVDAEAVHELHFGGGFVRKGGAPAAASGAGAGAAEEGEPDPERRRSKKEVRPAGTGCYAGPDVGLGICEPMSKLC